MASNRSANQISVASFSNLLATADFSMAFMRPIYLAPSAWLEHIPFAFWLTFRLRPKTVVELGTYNGCSYFAFCQAVERLGLATRCYAVDHWKGDEHAGFYSEDVFTRVQARNDELYSGFSRLVRSSFDEAAQHFPKGSIDLLHIDGHHSLGSVQHDFATWKPLLSDSAIVLLHDTNVRERGFGVYEMLELLRKDYPVFEFDHGHGLGVVSVGGRQNAGISSLFEITEETCAHRQIKEFFARLGRSCADAEAVRRLEAQISERNARHIPPPPSI